MGVRLGDDPYNKPVSTGACANYPAGSGRTVPETGVGALSLQDARIDHVAYAGQTQLLEAAFDFRSRSWPYSGILGCWLRPRAELGAEIEELAEFSGGTDQEGSYVRDNAS